MKRLHQALGTLLRKSRHQQHLKHCALMILGCVLALPTYSEQAPALPELSALAEQRRALTTEAEQYQQTLTAMPTNDSAPVQTMNPTIGALAAEMVAINLRLISIAEQEIALLQAYVAAAKNSSEAPYPVAEAMESKPLRVHSPGHSLAAEAENVERLRSLLSEYHTEKQAAERITPSDPELEQRAGAHTDAENRARIPFSADKVRLNGAEGNTALTQITRRIADQNLPESRKDNSLICSIRTHLSGALISNERRSLRPVGKNHYVARIRLKPGDTSLRILDQHWQIRLPEDISSNDFLVTLYRAPGNPPELHIFTIDDLLAEDTPHIPAWLPEDIQLTAKSG
jgi:hypothetical protein